MSAHLPIVSSKSRATITYCSTSAHTYPIHDLTSSMEGTAALDTSNINLEEAERKKPGARPYSQRASLQSRADTRFVKSKDEAKSTADKKDEHEEKGREDKKDKSEEKGRARGGEQQVRGGGGGSSAAASASNEDPEKKKKAAAKKDAISRKRRDADFRSGQKKMLSMLVKQVLANTQATRVFFSILCEVFLIKTDSEESMEMRKQTIAFQGLVEQLSGQQLGPPNLYAFAGLMKALVARGDGLGQYSAPMLELKEEFDKGNVEERAMIVKHCQLEKVYKPDQKKLVLCVQHMQVANLMAAIKLTGAEIKIGKGPMGYMERDLQEWLEALEAA